MQNVQMTALFALVGVASTPPALAQDYDASGCWQPAQECAEDEQRWNEDSDTADITTITNRCGGRITIRLCNETGHDGSSKWICHHYGLSDGESIKQHTFFATGSMRLRYTGSRSSASDSTCRAKLGIDRK